MAIVKVTKMTFASYIREHLDNMGEGVAFAKTILGDKVLGGMIGNVPDEQELYIDTSRVYAASGLQKAAETGDVIFTVYLDCKEDGDNVIRLKQDCFKEFLLAWNKDCRIVKARRMTFVSQAKKYMSEADPFAKALLGMTGCKKELDDTPDERVLFVSTRHAYAATVPFKEEETGASVFTVRLACQSEKDGMMYLADGCYEEFMEEWNKVRKEG